ncbi:MAG: hypothetical protein AB4352_29335 [Hormoscilla sp.]
MSNQNDPNVQAAKINFRGTIIAAVITSLITSLVPSSAGVIVNVHLNKETSKTIQGVKTEIEDIKSSASSIQGFRSATYEDKKGKKYKVFGPDTIAPIIGVGEDRDVKRQLWTIKSEYSGFTANWISGDAKGNPRIKDQEFASRLPAGYAYGTVAYSSSNVGDTSGEWRSDHLIGVKQVENELKIFKFHRYHNHITPQDILTLTLVQE